MPTEGPLQPAPMKYKTRNLSRAESELKTFFNSEPAFSLTTNIFLPFFMPFDCHLSKMIQKIKLN